MTRHLSESIPPLFQPSAQAGNEISLSAEAALNQRGTRGLHCEKVLARLRAGPATTAELIAVSSHRFSARVWDLRQQGHEIETRHDPETGQTVFTLKGESQ